MSRRRRHAPTGRAFLATGTLAALVLAAASSSALAQSAPTPQPPRQAPPKWGPFIDLDGKAGTQRNIGEGDLFVPLAQNADTLVFGDLRARFDDNDTHEGNFGLGVRHMLGSGWNLGAYGYFDRRRTAYGNDFNQATFGVEALSLDWDFRANVYRPLGSRVKDVDSLNTATIAGTTVTFRGGEEVAMTGFDGEVGWRVPVFDASGPTQLRLYGGGYRFVADGVDSVEGPRARLQLTVDDVPHLWQGSRLVLGAEIQHDGPRGTQEFATLSLRIPLQIFGTTPTRPSLTPMERRMTDAVVRDVDIVSQAGAFGPPETVTQTADGTSFTVINSSSTTDLPAAVSALANNSTAVLSGTFNTTATVDLGGNKSLVGGNITVRSASGRTAVLHTPATISSSNLTKMIVATGNNTISGLTIAATNSATGVAIFVNNGSGNITITNNTINMTQTGGTSATGISSTLGNFNVVISGNKFTLTGGASATAVNLAGPASTSATVTGNTFNISGATTNSVATVDNFTTIEPGSTGNVRTAGTCNVISAPSGFIGFTDGTTCP